MHTYIHIFVHVYIYKYIDRYLRYKYNDICITHIYNMYMYVHVSLV